MHAPFALSVDGVIAGDGSIQLARAEAGRVATSTVPITVVAIGVSSSSCKIWTGQIVKITYLLN